MDSRYWPSDDRKERLTPEYCDFTITGANTNTLSTISGASGSGASETEFTLKLRLEYPAVVTG